MEKIFYFASVLSGLDVLFTVAMITSIIGSIGLLIAIITITDECGSDDEEVETLRKAFKPVFIVAIISSLLAIFVPDKKTYLFMMGGKIVDTAVDQNPELGELPGNTLNLLNEYIKTETDKIRENNKED